MDGTRRLKRKLNKTAKDLQTEMEDAARDGLESVLRAQKGRITTNNAIASGELLRSGRIEEIQISGGMRFRLVNDAPHASLVEHGTGKQSTPSPAHVYYGVERTYKPPTYGPRLVQGLVNWIVQKPGLPYPGQTVYEAADNIAHSIGTDTERVPLSMIDASVESILEAGGSGSVGKGTPRQEFFWISLWSKEPEIKRQFERALRKAVD